MKSVYVLRHGEKDAAGVLAERGKRAAEALRGLLPHFAVVVSSESDRALLTAKLLTGEEPRIDTRASYALAPPAVSAAINALAAQRGISFWDAARQYGDAAVLAGVDEQAHGFNALVDELLGELSEGEQALVVSHDLTIAPAMALRGMTADSIDPLRGYVIAAGGGAVSVDRY